VHFLPPRVVVVRNFQNKLTQQDQFCRFFRLVNRMRIHKYFKFAKAYGRARTKQHTLSNMICIVHTYSFLYAKGLPGHQNRDRLADNAHCVLAISDVSWYTDELLYCTVSLSFSGTTASLRDLRI
jgi:hypothetical protein